MLTDSPNERPDRTPPATERPFAPSGIPGGAPSGTARPFADPATASPQDDLPYAGVLENVDQIWSAALDEPAQTPQQTPTQTAFPFGDDLRTGDAMDAVRPVVQEVATTHGIPAPVGLALVAAISKGDPNAEFAGGKAVGLAGVPLHQFAAGETATDPETNLSKAFGRLRQLHAETGDWTRAVLRFQGAADRQGNPRVLGRGADGFAFRDEYERARRRYENIGGG